MAALLVLLTATDEGLGSLFFGVPAPRHPAVKEALGIPDARRIVGVVSLGYAVPGPKSPSLRRHRRSGSEVTHWGRFGVAGEQA
jgi:nitroreductase